MITNTIFGYKIGSSVIRTSRNYEGLFRLPVSLNIFMCVTFVSKLHNYKSFTKQADLIHLGARYSPCMRPDANVIGRIEEDRNEERETACCIRNDGSGCHQTSYATCSVSVGMGRGGGYAGGAM